MVVMSRTEVQRKKQWLASAYFIIETFGLSVLHTNHYTTLIQLIFRLHIFFNFERDGQMLIHISGKVFLCSLITAIIGLLTCSWLHAHQPVSTVVAA